MVHVQESINAEMIKLKSEVIELQQYIVGEIKKTVEDLKIRVTTKEKYIYI